MIYFYNELNILSLIFAVLLISGCSKEGLKDFEDQQIFYGEREENDILHPEPGEPSVAPILYENWTSETASKACRQANASCGYSWNIEAVPTNRKYRTNTSDFGNIPSGLPAHMNISKANENSFNWSSNFMVCAVIIQAGPSAHVYAYPQGSCGDYHLTAPIDTSSGEKYSIRQVTFCFTDAPCKESNKCQQAQIAWTEGEPYSTRSNWATYTAYPGHCQYVDIYADQNILAGSVSFRDNEDGTAELNFQLDHGFIFDTIDENIKIQDYAQTPYRPPTPELFEHKVTTPYKVTSYTMVVPMNAFYGIHLNLAREFPCE